MRDGLKGERFYLPFLRHIAYRYRIYGVAIRSFRCNDTRDLHFRKRVPRFVNIEAVARRKLGQLDAAHLLQDLASPPGTGLRRWIGSAKGSTEFALMASGASASCGRLKVQLTLR